MSIYDINGNVLTMTADTVNIRKNGYIRSIAHRGYSDTAPENTLPAFKLAKVNGFDAVEMDIKWTSDGIPIILHDFSIARTARNSDGTEITSSIANASILSLTYSTLLNYDFGIWKSSTYAGTKIPTFEEAISLCKALQLQAYIEISAENATRAAVLVDIVKKYGMLRNVTWASKFTPGLQNVQNNDEFARVDYFVDYITTSVLTTAASLVNGTSIVVIGTNVGDSALNVQSAIDEGFEVECGLLSTEAQALALHPGITGAMSNSINARQVLYDNNIS